MSEKKSRPRLSLVAGSDAVKPAPLTRAQVAAQLGVSVSTVRRYEGDRLHPTIGADGVRYFVPDEVKRLAKTLAVELEASPRALAKAAVRAEELPRGELAGRVFERLEQRQSLAEIVIALRVPPDVVRDLYHDWLISLCEGELRRREPAVAPMDTEAGQIRRATLAELEQLLGGLPDGEPTRISVGSDCDEYYAGVPPETRYRLIVERGGFLVQGPIGVDAILRRWGRDAYRVTAYGFDPPGLRWEVFTLVDPR
jgi:transcriptional regulator with XRE-family HTH domain